MSRRGKVLFALMGVIWGIPYLLIKVAIRDLAVPTLVFARTAPAAILLVPIAWRQGLLRPLVLRWRAVVAYTAIEVAVPWFLLPTAEKQLSSSVSGLLIATVPLIGAVLAVALKSTERLDGRRLAGLLLGLAGVGVLVGIDLHGTDVISVVEVLLTAVGYAIGPVIISRRFADLPGLGLVAVSFALVALGYAPVAMTHLPQQLPAEVLAAVAVLSLVCTTLAFLLFFELIIEVGPQRATVVTYINPVVAVALGVVLLGEPLTLGLAIGAPMILAGSVVATRSSTSWRRKGAQTP